MSARREAAALRFIAVTLDEVRTWPADLQVAIHELVHRLPEGVLDLSRAGALAWAVTWRARVEETLAGSVTRSTTVEPWIAELAAGHRPTIEDPLTGPEIDLLAERYARLGPIALAIPWRRGPIAKA